LVRAGSKYRQVSSDLQSYLKSNHAWATGDVKDYGVIGRGKLNCPSEVVVVDDGSTDGTVAVAEKRGVRVVKLCRNLGIGGAVQTGLRLAHRERFERAVQIDGDGQHPPSEIVRLLEHMRAGSPPDIVVGSRRLELRGYQSPPARRLGQIWLRLWLYLVCRLKVTDPTSGFRLYGPRALALFQQTYAYDFPEPESLAVASAGGLRIVEQPSQWAFVSGRMSGWPWAPTTAKPRPGPTALGPCRRHRGRMAPRPRTRLGVPCG